MSTDSFMQRVFPHAKVIEHVDPNRYTIDLLGDMREPLPVEEWDRNLGLVLQVASVGEVMGQQVLGALTRERP